MKTALIALSISLLSTTAFAGDKHDPAPPAGGGTNINQNVNSNSSYQRQGQAQGQGQTQSNASTNQNNVNVSGNGGGWGGGYPTNPATAASAIAPSIWGGNVCSVGASAGVQVPLFGVSLGSQWEGENCEWRQKVALVSQIDKSAGKELACSKKEVYEAFKRAGQPCVANPSWEPKEAPQPKVAAAPANPCGPGTTYDPRGFCK